jgi:competence protein ComEA
MTGMDRLAPWLDRTRIAYLALALALVVGAWRLTAAAGGPGPPATPPVSPLVTAPVRADEPGPLVHVAGAVRRPGVYRLRSGARAVAALRRAGGPVRGADLSGLNLAAEVVDGQQLLVPARTPGGGGGAGGGSAAGGGTGPVSLSSATAEQLDELDGIGPTLAQRIVDWRASNGPFRTVDDLLDVPGIGETRLEALRARVTP